MDLERILPVKEDTQTLPGLDPSTSQKDEPAPDTSETPTTTFPPNDRPNKKKLTRVFSKAERAWVG